jgi:hypothetical protein
MMKCAMVLKDEKLTRHILERWRKADPGYAGCVARGQRLTDWAWDARGSGWANTVTREGLRLFEQRLQEAQRELEKALQINPSGWTAHARLLIVARGLGLPRAFVEEHFRRAVELRPRYAFAYETKLQYLQPRWHGTPEDLIEFGRQCAATGFWDEGIPRLFPYALNDCSTNPRDGGTIAEVFKVPEVWDAALTYYRAAEKGAGPDDRKTALNQLVKWGIYGQHYDDVVFACQKLRGPDRINPLIFRDADELDFLYDLVHAKTGKLTTQLRSPRKNDLALARTGAALAEGDCEAAAKALEKIEAADRLDRDKAACYRAALAAGRKLQRDKQIDLKGAEELEAFLGARPRWRHDGDKLVCELPAQGRTALTFPVGLRHAVVSGTLEWTEGISSAQIVTHTRALRDQVILRYLPNNSNTVELVRNGRLLNRAALPPGRLAFRLVFDRREDLLQPAAGIVWKAGVYDDVPSGFRIQVHNHNRPTVVTIRDLRIELTD